jgi:hypothetical protein
MDFQTLSCVLHKITGWKRDFDIIIGTH